MILLGVGIILGTLYGILLLIVRGASKLIDLQQQTIQERTDALETLSAHLLTLEERDKKRIALDLHEGLVQTLCNLKFNLAATLEDVPKKSKIFETMEKVLPTLQGAIDEVQGIAQGLRPSSLDTLGLLPTIDWLLRGYEQTNPEIRIDSDISLAEDDIPTRLRIVIYRIAEATVRVMVDDDNTDRVQLNLQLIAKNITLEIIGRQRYSAPTATTYDEDPVIRQSFAKAQEQTLLSGGLFSTRYSSAEGLIVRAHWATVAPQASPDAEPDERLPAPENC